MHHHRSKPYQRNKEYTTSYQMCFRSPMMVRSKAKLSYMNMLVQTSYSLLKILMVSLKVDYKRVKMRTSSYIWFKVSSVLKIIFTTKRSSSKKQMSWRKQSLHTLTRVLTTRKPLTYLIICTFKQIMTAASCKATICLRRCLEVEWVVDLRNYRVIMNSHSLLCKIIYGKLVKRKTS